MKLVKAIAHIAARNPRFASRIADMTLEQVENMIEQTELDIRAWQVLAHSKRAQRRWERDPKSMRSTEVTPQWLASLTRADLNKRAGMGGTEAVRALINAEIRRRAQENSPE
jgi:hypothetical protein